MPGPNADRDARIAAAARLGQTHEAIAREHGISRARVSQIAKAATPRSPEETQRQLVAERLRSRWAELEKLVRHPPEMHSAIGRVVIGSDGKPVINASVIVQAIKTQLQIEAQYRQMFGMDLGTRPTIPEDQAMALAVADIARHRAALGTGLVVPPAVAAGGAAAIHAYIANRQYHAQIVATSSADDDVIDAEIVDDDRDKSA